MGKESFSPLEAACFIAYIRLMNKCGVKLNAGHPETFMWVV